MAGNQPAPDMAPEPTATASSSPEALVERGVQVALSAAQRQALRARLADLEGLWTVAEIAAVPDGTEPGFVFQPYTGSGRIVQQKRQADG